MKGFALIFILAIALVVPAAASADSIVYIKDGNVWLSSPDGAKGYQVTFDGGYSSPSQANDGTIAAIRAKQLVRLDRSGYLLSAIDAMGTGSNPNFYGPYEARISPDGTKIAYWFGMYDSYYSSGCSCTLWHVESATTWSRADQFTDPTTDSDYYKGITQPEWLTNDRLIGGYDFWMTLWTYQIGTGHGYVDSAAQYAAQFKDAQGYNYYFGDPALSPDGTKLALTDGGDANTNTRMFLASVPGPIWVGNAPYTNDYLGSTPVDQPVLSCFHNYPGAVWNPTWQSDSVHLAYSLPDGIHLMDTTGYDHPDPQTGDCPADHLIIPGGAEPAFGPKDVDLSQKPAAPPVAPQGGTGDPGSTPTGPTTPSQPTGGQPQAFSFTASLAPNRFRAAKAGPAIAKATGTTIKYSASAPAKVRLTIKGVKGALSTSAKPGANKLRFFGRIAGKTLKPGRYTLTIAATPLSGSGSKTVTLKFRIVR